MRVLLAYRSGDGLTEDNVVQAKSYAFAVRIVRLHQHSDIQ